MMAHLDAMHNRNKRNSTSCKKFCQNLEQNLEELRQSVINGTWKPRGYLSFIKRDGRKDRLIDYDPEYADNVVQHAIAIVLLPLMKRSLIRDTYSGVRKRGIHDGMRRVREALTTNPDLKECYVVKTDITKFYPSINIELLKQQLRKKIKDNRAYDLIAAIIDSHPNGLPIGNYLSQHLANFFLSPVDHYMKETAGVHYYYRYCDDIVMLAQDKATAKHYLSVLEERLALLGLSVKANKQVFPISRPGHLDFLGYVFDGSHIRLRKSIERRLRRLALLYRRRPCLTYAQGLMSYYGWLLWIPRGLWLWNKVTDGLDLQKVIKDAS